MHSFRLTAHSFCFVLAACGDSSDVSRPDTNVADGAADAVAEVIATDTASDSATVEIGIDATADVADASEPPETADTTDASEDMHVDVDVPLEPSPIGGPCLMPADCGAPESTFCVPPDAFWKDGYCIGLGCNAQVACAEGTHCGFRDIHGNGYCLPSCAGSPDCARDSYDCWDVDGDHVLECGPSATGTGTFGSACDGIDDCAGGIRGRCLFESTGAELISSCTTLCSRSEDCAAGARCAFRDRAGRGHCVATCGHDSDCAAPKQCADRDFDGVDECGLSGIGAIPLGQPCGLQVECDTGPNALCLGGVNFPGICSAFCMSDDDCSGPGHCVGVGDLVTGFCLESCADEGECSAGQPCVDFDGDGRGECGPFGAGVQPIGHRCAGAGDCGGGAGIFCAYPALICTRFCDSDDVCGDGAHCTVDPRGAGQCARDCTDKGECDSGLDCLDTDGDGRKECALGGIGTGPLGSACFDHQGCEPGLACYDTGPGGTCTIGCASTADCPAGSRCAAQVELGTRQCLRTCESDGDCRADDGWRCFDGDGDGTSECRPFAGGSALLGDTCATTGDCAGGLGAFCYEGSGTRTGFCTRRCEGAVGCGTGGACVDLPAYLESSVCVGECSAGCGPGLECTAIDPDVDAEVCLDGCASDSDCRFDPRRPVCDVARGVCSSR